MKKKYDPTIKKHGYITVRFRELHRVFNLAAFFGIFAGFIIGFNGLIEYGLFFSYDIF